MVTISSSQAYRLQTDWNQKAEIPKTSPCHLIPSQSKENHTQSAALAPNFFFFPNFTFKNSSPEMIGEVQSFENELPLLLAIDLPLLQTTTFQIVWPQCTLDSWNWIGQQKYIPKGYSDFRATSGEGKTHFTAAHQLLPLQGLEFQTADQCHLTQSLYLVCPLGKFAPSYHIWNKLEVSWFLRYVFIGHNQISLSTNSTLSSKDTWS